MDFEQQWAIFDERLKRHYGKPKTSTARGASNAPLVLENGFRFGLFNIDLSQERIDALVEARRPLVLVTGLVLPPRHALSMALAFEGEALERVGDRLATIRKEPILSGSKAGSPKGKANKVRVYLHPDGLFLHQDADRARIDPTVMGPSLWPTGAWYADIASEPDFAPVSLTWLGHVGGLLAAMPRGPMLEWLRPRH